ncbi:NUMOD4 domain-containing protein [Chryseobacterium sp. CBTAP 102]|uniref:NUMOD4 domain-containing protein n=1 Tax=Chryseobacterium sp. CBTAP 102 TaxID=2135644 RepID=UPI000D76CB98|nr:NUMOD4 domain-containing protein [Chryseobacterium sp. CBTAP 102]
MFQNCPYSLLLKSLLKEINSIRTVLNSKEIFNNSLWEKVGKPRINKKSPPAIFDLSLRDLPDERWKPLPGFEGKYVISDKGRVKRLSGWKSGAELYGEEQILSLKFKKSDSPYLYFTLRTNEGRFEKRLPRMLYYCFIEEFDLNDRTLWIVNKNETQWDIDMSKLLLRSKVDSFKNKK